MVSSVGTGSDAGSRHLQGAPQWISRVTSDVSTVLFFFLLFLAVCFFILSSFDFPPKRDRRELTHSTIPF